MEGTLAGAAAESANCETQVYFAVSPFFWIPVIRFAGISPVLRDPRGLQSYLTCEQVGGVAKRLEFESIPRRITEKHGGLFTRLAFKPNVRPDFALDTRVGYPPGKGFEIIP